MSGAHPFVQRVAPLPCSLSPGQPLSSSNPPPSPQRARSLAGTRQEGSPQQLLQKRHHFQMPPQLATGQQPPSQPPTQPPAQTPAQRPAQQPWSRQPMPGRPSSVGATAGMSSGNSSGAPAPASTPCARPGCTVMAHPGFHCCSEQCHNAIWGTGGPAGSGSGGAAAGPSGAAARPARGTPSQNTSQGGPPCPRQGCCGRSWNGAPGECCGVACRDAMAAGAGGAAQPCAAAAAPPQCKRPGCTQPAHYDSSRSVYSECCSKSCLQVLKGVPLCRRRTCCHPTYNGMPGEYCNLTCRDLPDPDNPNKALQQAARQPGAVPWARPASASAVRHCTSQSMAARRS